MRVAYSQAEHSLAAPQVLDPVVEPVIAPIDAFRDGLDVVPLSELVQAAILPEPARHIDGDHRVGGLAMPDSPDSRCR